MGLRYAPRPGNASRFHFTVALVVARASLAYNAIYIFSEAAITLAVLAVPTVRETFSRIKRLAIG